MKIQVKCELIGKEIADMFISKLKENNIDTIEKAFECFELWDTDNGITLHRSCHSRLGECKIRYMNELRK